MIPSASVDFPVEKSLSQCYTVFNSQETGESPVRERRRKVPMYKPVLRMKQSHYKLRTPA
jgi:hypothetical protein